MAPPRTGKKNPLREQINNEGFSQWTVCFHRGGHASWGCSVCETLHFAPTGKPQAVAPGCITSDTSDWDGEFSQLHSKHFLEAHGPDGYAPEMERILERFQRAKQLSAEHTGGTWAASGLS